ncbi:hypothetical protein DBV15_03144 [Temnothorax longispinosus]|uniref:Uncharacterized protein n=1 Tax=Temnothorax longispinosus TaxID=300112 RepID=A0A4S2KTB0_9HYME|nr:hypothetical protein DBV15_03144 [Temnothorax longispinosus]
MIRYLTSGVLRRIILFLQRSYDSTFFANKAADCQSILP